MAGDGEELADASEVVALRAAARPLTGSEADYDPLLQSIGNARFVLLGESTHGTHEFHRERAAITRRLVSEWGFNAIAIDADWPDAYRVNRFVRADSDDGDAETALSGFARFPAWMWRNRDVAELVSWLRGHNEGLAADVPRVGFYGLDLYSLFSSIEAVLGYLEGVDPEAAARARERYASFDRFDRDSQRHGVRTGLGLERSREEEALRQLRDLRRSAAEYAAAAPMADDELFYAEQNALVIKNAEIHDRAMFGERSSSWNLRDRHMAEMLESLSTHIAERDGHAKIVVWAHNAHLGDARATEMALAGELNLGELARKRFGREVVSVGFTTYQGTVTAASAWGAAPERKNVRRALSGSYEAMLHATRIPNLLLDLRGEGEAVRALAAPRIERAIGVIYAPQTERASHYFQATLPAQFDWLVHFDDTRAVVPLEPGPLWVEGEAPGTFPSTV